VVSLTFGGAQDGDLNTDLGCAWSIDGPEMLHARSHTLLAARAARFDTPLDGVFANVHDAEGFERDTALSRRLGYRGRKLIHPSQIEPCNRLYRPSAAELDYYARVLEAFDQAVAQGTASTTVDGRMIDAAMANAARRVLEADATWKKAGENWTKGNEMASGRGNAPSHFLAAPNGAAFSSNSSITVPGSDSSVSATVMRWPSEVRTLAMRRGCQSVCPSICRMIEISSTTAL